MERVGFVGLGVMGGPMAMHLHDKGHTVTVWNRTASKSEPHASRGIGVSQTLQDLAKDCTLIFLCVNRSEDVESCLDALLETANPNTLFVDHSTIPPVAAKKFATRLNESGMHFVDAPITGGSMGAQKGTLTIFCGGTETDIDRAMPYLQAYAKRAERVGPSGSGQQMKLANQIAVGGALQALCESLAFAKKAGLDLAQCRDMLSGGAAGSWAFENYGPKILNSDWSPGFSIKNQRKDFGYCKEAAAEIGAAIPGTEVTDDLLRAMEESGRGEETTAALYEYLLTLEPDR